MRVTRASVTPTCAICERTLLMGERATRFSADGEVYLDVCSLCHDLAVQQGWVREGLPVSPALQQPFRRRKSLWTSLIGARPSEEQPVVEKRTVPKERVRLDTDTVTEERQISEEVRKEQIDTEGLDRAS